MGQTADELKNQIENQRQELGDNLQQLEEKVRSTVDWRTQFEQKPWAGVGLAFGGGFLLSMLMPSGGGGGSSSSSASGGSKSQSPNYMANYRVTDDSQRWGQMGSSGTSPSSSSMSFSSGGSKSKSSSPEMTEVTETLENIRGAVMGMAATRLRSFLAEAVPGFEDEYEEARTRRGASSASKIDSSGSSSSSPTSSQGSQGSNSIQASTSSGSSDSSKSVPPSQSHDSDAPLSGYIASTEGSSSTQSGGSHRS